MFEFLFILKLLLLVAAISCPAVSLESPEPEVHLKPRNFNPHPYIEGGRIPTLQRFPSAVDNVADRTGPVLFPPNPEDNIRNNALDIGHPYAGVVRKQKMKLKGRFSIIDQENNINPRVYSGLANYAAKVLKKPAGIAQHNGISDPSLAGHKKNYAFSYTVHDQETGDDFSHSQSQNARATNGEYRVKLPDGRVQIVSYTADINGYKADVKYADDDDSPRHDTGYQQQHVLLPDYDYYDELQGHPEQVVTQIGAPLYDNVLYHKPRKPKFGAEYIKIYQNKVPSPYVLEDKLQIYTNEQQNVVQIDGNVQPQQKYGNLVPYSQNNIVSGPLDIIVSTVSPPRYSQVYEYITPSKYSISHSSHHPVKPTNGYYKRR